MKNFLIQSLIVIASKEVGVNIKEKRRTTQHVIGRYIVYTLLREQFYFTYKKIAKIFNIKQHGTIINGIRELMFIAKSNKKVSQNIKNVNEAWLELSEKEGVKMYPTGIKDLEERITLLILETEVLKTQLHELKNLKD